MLSLSARHFAKLSEVITMLRTRTWVAGVVFFAGTVILPASALAQSQTINFTLGGFWPKGEDSRVAGDVLVADLSEFPPLLFEVGDFKGGTFGAEWLFGIGDFLEAGVGASYYQRTVPSIYADKIHSNGAEIEQDLKLRITPITGTLRVFPTGRHGSVQPYIGAGVSLLSWRYSETGEFVDPFDDTIFRANFVKSDKTAAPVFLGGVRFPLAEAFLLGGEVRYQKAEGDLPLGGTDGFLGDKIDLGGWTGNFTFGIRF